MRPNYVAVFVAAYRLLVARCGVVRVLIRQTMDGA